jgi:predicted transport protein
MMAMPKYVKFEKISLKNHPILSEAWVQDRIAEDPSILGLGELILKDKERRQPKAGRLDLLLQDPDSSQRYEVEVQLGNTDESHIIRTIEYWDLERKRWPNYDHTAVIVAEDITSRFLNVISLFNGVIPLIAIQMNALKYRGQVSLIFTTVLDQMTLGREEEDEDKEVVDRSYWEKRGTKGTVALADKLLEYIHSFAPDFDLKYNKFYIGLAREGQPNNFSIFKPQKNAIRIEVRMKRSEDFENQISEKGLDLMDYNTKWRRYRIRLSKLDVNNNEEFITQLLKQAFTESSG